jgi:hypothetical protein
MANQAEASTKRLAISKANAQILAAVGIAAFITVFCLIASRAVWSQTRYQARVTSASEKAKQQLIKNISAFNSLKRSYERFDSANPNIIGGSATGGGNNAGDNATIVLHALPDKYDFPALTASLEKILRAGSFNITSITGTDDQLNQQSNTSSPNPQYVPMPFSFTVDNTNYTAAKQLITTLEASIRPIQIDSVSLTGASSNMTVTITAHTYYQPAKTLSITKEVVK